MDRRYEERKSIKRSWLEFQEFTLKSEQLAMERIQQEKWERENDENYQFHQVSYQQAKLRKPIVNHNHLLALVSPRAKPLRNSKKSPPQQSPYGLMEKARARKPGLPVASSLP